MYTDMAKSVKYKNKNDNIINTSKKMVKDKRKRSANSPMQHSSKKPKYDCCKNVDNEIFENDNTKVTKCGQESSMNFGSLPLEILCHILSRLPICDAVKLSLLSKQLRAAVDMFLRLKTSIDFTEGVQMGWMPAGFTDTTFLAFLKRCPELTELYGLHIQIVAKRRQRDNNTLSVPGIIAALKSCPKLTGVETSNVFLFEALLEQLPQVEILRGFKNRECVFPAPMYNSLLLTSNPRLCSLSLTGVVIPELPHMEHLRHLHLRFVQLTSAQPFKDFHAPSLKSFIMHNCAGPRMSLPYVPLISALVTARSLSRLELVRVPFLGGLFQHFVEDSWRSGGFRSLQKILFSVCKNITEADLGYLMITSNLRLREVAIPPPLTKDSFFLSLLLSGSDFPYLDSLSLGYVDDFSKEAKWTNEQLSGFGLTESLLIPSILTDTGMATVGKVFPHLVHLDIYNCPHLIDPTGWIPSDGVRFQNLQELHITRCQTMRLREFERFLTQLPKLEVLLLEQVFEEPPQGCSRVGLSAGTGLGVSAAMVSNAEHGMLAAAAAAHVPQQPAQVPQEQAAQPVPADDQDEVNSVYYDDEDDDISSDGYSGYAVDVYFDESLDGHEKDYIDNSGDSSLMEDKADEHTKSQLSDSDTSKNNNLNNSQPTNSSENLSGGNKVDFNSFDGEKACSSHTIKLSENVEVPIINDDESKKTSLPVIELANNENQGVNKLQLPAIIESTSNESQSTSKTQLNFDELDKKESNEMDTSSINCSVDSQETVSPNTSSAGVSSRRKGKSVCGAKKGLVKPLTGSDKLPQQVNQSCQTVLEDIRHTVKKSSQRSTPAVQCQNNNVDGSAQDAVRETSSLRQDDGNNSQAMKPVHSKVEETPSGNNLHAGNIDASQKKNNTCDVQKTPEHIVNTSQSCESISSASSAAIRNTAPDPNLSNCNPLKKDKSENKCDENVSVESSSCSTMSANEPASVATATSEPESGDSKTSPNLDESEIYSTTCNKFCKKGGATKVNKATSTSDPVIGELPVQMLQLTSQTLVSLTLMDVGVSDLILSDCPNLTSLTAFHCRALKRLSLRGAPALWRTTLSLCRDLQFNDVVEAVCCQPINNSRLVSFQPVASKYDSAEVWQVLNDHLMVPSRKWHYCIIEDFSPDCDSTSYNKARVMSWVELFSNVSRLLIERLNFEDATNVRELAAKDLGYCLTGYNENGSSWKIHSDQPLLKLLSAKPDLSGLPRHEMREGIYNPALKGQLDVTSCMQFGNLEQLVNVPLFKHTIYVYINVPQSMEQQVTN